MEKKYPDISEMKPERQKRLDATIAALDKTVADLPAKIAETQRAAIEVLANEDKSFADIDEINDDDRSIK